MAAVIEFSGWSTAILVISAWKRHIIAARLPSIRMAPTPTPSMASWSARRTGAMRVSTCGLEQADHDHIYQGMRKAGLPG
jgi:hypothetical protein